MLKVESAALYIDLDVWIYCRRTRKSRFSNLNDMNLPRVPRFIFVSGLFTIITIQTLTQHSLHLFNQQGSPGKYKPVDSDLKENGTEGDTVL